jgi:hypothetical protein
MTLEMHVLALGQVQIMAELNLLMVSNQSSWKLDLQRQYIHKQTITKTCTDSPPHKKTTQSMHSAIAGSMNARR